MKTDKKNTLISGVFILTAANLLVKVIGLVFKIPIQRLIGDEGMGYFNMAYNIYSWLYLVSTAGLPVAISVMVSAQNAKGYGKNAKKVFSVAVGLFSIIGLACALSMFLFSRKIASAVEMENAYLCAMAIAPTLFFVCISSAVRGYFQGFGNMAVTAVSQVTESAGKVIFGLIFAIYSISKGYPVYVTAAFAISGVTVGTFLSMVFCIICKSFFSPKLTGDGDISRKTVFKQLISVAFPITVSSSIIGLINVVDTVISASRLQDIGYSQIQATEIYGNYTTLAVSLFNMPTVLIYPIACAVVPHLTKIFTMGKNAEKVISSTVKTACVISAPCAVGLGVLSYNILSLLFLKSSAALAAPMLTALAPSVFFCAMLSVTNSVLQASSNERLPIISMITGIAVKLISSYILIGIPQIGRLGIPLGTCLCYLVIIIMNFIFMCKKTHVSFNVFQTFVKPAVCASICGASAYFSNLAVMKFTDSSFAVFLPIFAAVTVYAVCIFKTKTVDKYDILYLPKGEKICSILEKFKLI